MRHATSGLATRARPAAAAALRCGGRRGASDFAFVIPGPVAPRRHVLRFRESERDEAWRHEGIPVLDDGLSGAAQGRALARYTEAAAAAEAELQAAVAREPQLALVHAMLDHLGPAAHDALTAAERAELTAAPAPEERARMASPVERRRALLGLRDDVEALLAAAARVEADALDSGEADLAFPLPQATREALQVARSRDVLLAALRVARVMSLVGAAQDAELGVRDRALLSDAIAAAQAPMHLGFAPRSLFDSAHDGDESPGDRPMSLDERRDFNHGEGSEALDAQALATGDRLALLPRRKLPTPLHADAPSAHLADVARLIDTNPSYKSHADKAYILSYYADAVGGKESAFDTAAEDAAFAAPQPQWGVYDPQLVTLQDASHDALQGKGAFSRASGQPWMDALVPPSTSGRPDANPTGAHLTASEEVGATMAVYDAAAARELATTTAAITEMLERSMGLPAGRLARAGGGGGSGGAGSQAAAIAAKRAAAAAAGAAGGKAQAGAAAKSSTTPPPPPAAGAGVSDDVAEGAIRSFFARYNAGEAVRATPAPPRNRPFTPLAGSAPKEAAAKKGGKKK